MKKLPQQEPWDFKPKIENRAFLQNNELKSYNVKKPAHTRHEEKSPSIQVYQADVKKPKILDSCTKCSNKAITIECDHRLCKSCLKVSYQKVSKNSL